MRAGYPTLYTATGALFGALIVAIMAGTVLNGAVYRQRFNEDKSDVPRPWWVLVYSVVAIAGLCAAVIALAMGHGTGALFVVVLACAGLAVALVAVEVIRPVLGHDGQRSRVGAPMKTRATIAAVACALVVGVVIGQLVVRRPPHMHPLSFRIYGTCAAGDCGVNKRRAPARAGRSLGTLFDGDHVKVICQTTGQELVLPRHRRSNLWDRLADGTYVSDLFVSTSKAGRFSADVPRCRSDA